MTPLPLRGGGLLQTSRNPKPADAAQATLMQKLKYVAVLDGYTLNPGDLDWAPLQDRANASSSARRLPKPSAAWKARQPR